MTLWDKVVEVNDKLRSYGKEAVEVKTFPASERGGQRPPQYGYSPQWEFSAVNEVFGPENFDYDVVEVREFLDDQNHGEVVARIEVRLRCSPDGEWVTRSQYGTSRCYASVGDAIKGAITNAIGKALALYGVGEDAYKGLLEAVYKGKNGDMNSSRDNNFATPKQVTRIRHELDEYGLNEAMLIAFLNAKMEGEHPSLEKLSRPVASRIIERFAEDGEGFKAEIEEVIIE